MEVRDHSNSLMSVVEKILNEYEEGDFHDYWELSGEVSEEFPDRKFYVHTGRTSQPFYGASPTWRRLNVAILTDNSIIDIEGNLNKPGYSNYVSPNESGSLIITPLKSIESVEFHMGAIQTLRESSASEPSSGPPSADFTTGFIMKPVVAISGRIPALQR